MKYALASSSWGDEEKQAMLDVIESGRFTMGPKVEEFEKQFATQFNKRFAVFVSSGSAANLMSIASLCHLKEKPLLPGHEVIVPAISWATTYYPLQQYGLKLRFLDVDLHTLNMDVTKLEQALTPNTRMIVGVNILGNPAPLDFMRSFCDKHDLLFFEDNCESMGASLNGIQAGTWGDIGTFSSFFSHQISTMEGGVMVTDNEEIYQLAKSIRAHGWSRDLPEENLVCEKKGDAFFEAYRFILPGYNLRPLELSGAVGVRQLEKLDDLVAIRRKNATYFIEKIGQIPGLIIQQENGKSSWFSFTIILQPELGDIREKVMSRLRDNDIEFRIITGGCFPRHDVIKYFDYDIVGNLNNANMAHDRGFFVGNAPVDLRQQIDHLYKVLTEVL